MREHIFLAQLTELLDTPVEGLAPEQQLALVEALCAARRRAGATPLPTCTIVPFLTGRRPTHEIAHPGLGSSDNTSLIWGAPAGEDNRAYLLYAIAGLEHYTPAERDAFALDVTLSFAGSDGSLHTAPIPGWAKRPLDPLVFAEGTRGQHATRRIALREAAGCNLVLALAPGHTLLPGAEWRWDDLDSRIRSAATDGADPFTFGHLFSQMLHVSLRLTRDGAPVAVSQAMIDVCDTRRVGSLYERIIEHLIKPDTARQARAAGIAELELAYHPWYPVLLIGSDKANLYTDALIEDIVHKKLHLTDPRWLMRVGLYLEFLTCLGIFEAVKDDVGDLLSAEERAAYERSPLFAAIRSRLNPAGWRHVWELREITLPQIGVPQTGPVSALNLLQKKRATLAFLEVHHEDLKHAIELAGRNEYNAQETWHRVFRDAERAVLRKTAQAFPELAFLDRRVMEFVLWHRKGVAEDGEAWGALRQVTALVGDQDGLYASACNQYRASMNEVATWAKHQRLMDYTGDECIPARVSLLQTYMGGRREQVERLQIRDGYAGSLDTIAKLPDTYRSDEDQVLELLSQIALFNVLTEAERRGLATCARRLALGPLERIIIEGREGSSLFVVGAGTLEVLIRQSDGTDQRIDLKGRGDVVGEISLLTGAKRAATVRALDGAVVYEIGKQQYAPLIHARPALVDELAAVMARHMENIGKQRAAYDREQSRATLSKRIRQFIFGK